MKLSRLFYTPFPRNYWPITLPWRWGRMLTNPAIWPSRLPWNKLQMTCLVVDFKVEITTKSLSLVNLNETRTKRLEWLFSLRENGYSNKEISDYLNDRGIRSPNGKVYSPKLIWVTLKKYQNRFKRLNDYQITSVVEKLFTRSD
jgi:hypothetical protein